MRILLIGASGMIGSRVLAEAVSRGHQVIAVARHAGKIAAGPNVEVMAADATNAQALSPLVRRADVVVSSTSPRGGTGDQTAEAVAVSTAVINAIGASRKRYLVVGGAGSLNLPDGSPLLDKLPPEYKGEATAMRAVRDQLKAGGVEWTFFSPAAIIMPGERTGKYRLGTTTLISDERGQSRISAEDYAHALVSELEHPRYGNSQMTIGY